jgi:SAM-dependent methyltransferase
MQDHGDPAKHDGFAADTYGQGFADVYDRWYPADPATSAAVQRISSLAGPGAAVLELGVGTGRLAVPLARAGHSVVGLDASGEMLEQLARNGSGLPEGALRAHRVDLGADDPWPPGPYAVVVAAFNLVCNLVDPVAQARLFERAAAVLGPGGHLVVETFLAAPLEQRQRHLEVREVRADGVVLIASDTEPDTGVVTGSHIELRDGEPVRLRPWRLRLTAPDELDTWAAHAGLERVAQWQDWAGMPHDPEAPSAARIGIYRAGGAEPGSGPAGS